MMVPDFENKETEKLAVMIARGFDDVYKRFDGVDERLDGLEARVGAIEKTLPRFAANSTSSP